MAIHPAATLLTAAVPGAQLVTIEMVELAGANGLPVVLLHPFRTPDAMPGRLVGNEDRMVFLPDDNELAVGTSLPASMLKPGLYGLAPCDCGGGRWGMVIPITRFDGWEASLTRLGAALAKHVLSGSEIYCRADVRTANRFMRKVQWM